MPILKYVPEIDWGLASGVVARELRTAAKRTQRDLAEALGIARPNYARFERGVHTPHLELLHRLANVYGLDLAVLMDRIVAVAYERAGLERPRQSGSRDGR